MTPGEPSNADFLSVQTRMFYNGCLHIFWSRCGCCGTNVGALGSRMGYYRGPSLAEQSRIGISLTVLVSIVSFGM